jgi:hypothetical protein
MANRHGNENGLGCAASGRAESDVESFSWFSRVQRWLQRMIRSGELHDYLQRGQSRRDLEVGERLQPHRAGPGGRHFQAATSSRPYTLASGRANSREKSPFSADSYTCESRHC